MFKQLMEFFKPESELKKLPSKEVKATGYAQKGMFKSGLDVAMLGQKMNAEQIANGDVKHTKLTGYGLEVSINLPEGSLKKDAKATKDLSDSANGEVISIFQKLDINHKASKTGQKLKESSDNAKKIVQNSDKKPISDSELKDSKSEISASEVKVQDSEPKGSQKVSEAQKVGAQGSSVKSETEARPERGWQSAMPESGVKGVGVRVGGNVENRPMQQNGPSASEVKVQDSEPKESQKVSEAQKSGNKQAGVTKESRLKFYPLQNSKKSEPITANAKNFEFDKGGSVKSRSVDGESTLKKVSEVIEKSDRIEFSSESKNKIKGNSTPTLASKKDETKSEANNHQRSNNLPLTQSSKLSSEGTIVSGIQKSDLTVPEITESGLEEVLLAAPEKGQSDSEAEGKFAVSQDLSLLKKELTNRVVAYTQRSSFGSQQSSNPGAWQQHRFTLGNGKSLNIALREQNGKIQLQLSTANAEVQKLLQQHLQEIKDHLIEKFDSEVELYLKQDGEQQNNQQFADELKKNDISNAGAVTMESETEEAESRNNLQRSFGFNNNEWIG